MIRPTAAKTSIAPVPSGGALPQVLALEPVPDVLAALRAVAGLPHVVLLDSALVREPVGRYSFLAADPFAWHLVPQARYGMDHFAPLRMALRDMSSAPVPGLPPFQGGVAGLLGYGLGAAWERLPRARFDEFQIPDMAVGIYDWVLAWDHLAGQAWLISQGFPERDMAARRSRARQRLEWVAQRLASADSRQPAPPPHSSALAGPALAGRMLERSELAPQFPVRGLPELTSNFSAEGYLQAVGRAIEYIRAGDVFQVNLSQRLLYPYSGQAVELYARLRACNPAPFAGLLFGEDWAVVSASPERLVSLRDQCVEARPIKGTRRRGHGPEADLYTRDELRESEKDQAENIMIADLLRNDLSRVCEPGSIRVPALCQVETYETVQHLVSVVQGRLRAGGGPWDLLPAVFPGGSISGAPKVRAVQIIAELEPTARGAYCGSLAYVGFDGALDSNLLIRTFTLRHGWAQCPVGGGVVAQSSPEAEYEETWHKAAGMLRALEPQ